MKPPLVALLFLLVACGGSPVPSPSASAVQASAKPSASPSASAPAGPAVASSPPPSLSTASSAAPLGSAPVASSPAASSPGPVQSAAPSAPAQSSPPPSVAAKPAPGPNCVALVEASVKFPQLGGGTQTVIAVAKNATGAPVAGAQGSAFVQYSTTSRTVSLPNTSASGATSASWSVGGPRGTVGVTVTESAGGCTATGGTSFEGR